MRLHTYRYNIYIMNVQGWRIVPFPSWSGPYNITNHSCNTSNNGASYFAFIANGFIVSLCDSFTEQGPVLMEVQHRPDQVLNSVTSFGVGFQ